MYRKILSQTLMLKESMSQSHREYLIIKSKPRTPSCKTQCSLHVTKLPLKYLKAGVPKLGNQATQQEVSK